MQTTNLPDNPCTFFPCFLSPTGIDASPPGGCPSSSFTVSYRVNSCGMSPERAHAAARRVNLHSPEKADAVLHLLRTRGLNQSQVAECVRKKPMLLLLEARVLSPKLEVLEGVGLSGAGLAEILPRYPCIADLSVNNRMVSSVAFLRTVVRLRKTTSSAFSMVSLGSLATTPSTRLRLMLKLC